MVKAQRNVRRAPRPAVGASHGKVRRIYGLDLKAALRLQAAVTIDQFWAATQALIQEAAPSHSRWFCVRPIRMVTAMMLLRETTRSPKRGSRVKSSPKTFSIGEKEAVLLKELFAKHPALAQFRDNPSLPIVHFRFAANDWVYRRHRWKFGAALAFWNHDQLEGVLLLHRTKAEGDYSPLELQCLRAFHSHFETALCRVIATRRQQAQKHLLAGILKPLPLPLVLCDWNLNVVCESFEGLQARAIWELGPDRAQRLNLSSSEPLPDDVIEFCRSKIKKWEDSGPRQRASLEKQEHQLAHSRRPGFRLKLRLVRQKQFPLIKPLLLLHFEPISGDHDFGRADKQVLADKFVLLACLSARERELALLICHGHSNDAVARLLKKSVYTIKAQLHSIFEKLGVKSRSQLIALLRS